MISDVQLFQVYGAMARYAAEAQSVSATNIARANEPGYKAKEIESFDAFLARVSNSAATDPMTASFRVTESQGPMSPNGNSVSLEQEIFNSAEAMGQHSLALSVYTKSMDLLRTAIGRR
ncbi:FlgB family protein [Hyphomonas sp.]|jgi:flagellar basal-body rod protein FlgB|uniref:FlgB family protein n=1 Tax=Hyphomonas sp. TaxID=87 RepID=UPI0025B87EC2|nr:FlgB family protein [Hyphomonas sp.]